VSLIFVFKLFWFADLTISLYRICGECALLVFFVVVEYSF